MNYRLTIAATLALAFPLAACELDDLEERFDLSTDEEEVDTDALACMEIENLLTLDLPLSPDTAESDYKDVSFFEWCENNVTRDDLEDFVGNANAWEADEDDPQITATSPTGRATRPSPAHGARLDLNVAEAEGNMPFVRKIHFADWEGPGGTCALEMRVYQKDLGATGNKPLLYLHGGGWRNRTTTMTAAEVLTSHLIDNHVVFMPAYPLNRDRDGPEACRNAGFEDILETAQLAFDWVQENMAVFGVNPGEPVDLMGHSAGGQLAAWLATQNAQEVGRFVNFYGPTEFADFVDRAHDGGDYAEDFEYARRTMAFLFGLDSIDQLERPYPEAIMQNSLSEIVATEGVGAIPPFFTVQGNADSTVPVEQAVISCNAVGGNATTAGGEYDCGDGSRLIVVEGADHNLDRRCVTGIFPDDAEDLEGSGFDRYCPTANADPEQVRNAVQAAYDWLTDE